MITLRGYQEEALDTVMADLVREPNVLLQAATGAGKTIIFASIIRRWLAEYPDLRIVVAAHRRELITQAWDKLLTVWPEGRPWLAQACASLGEVDTSAPVVIGSVQTLARRKLRRPADLLIIDEAHRIPAVETGGQYHDIINIYREANPVLRVLGVTATPFRLGHGRIYGQDCRPGRSNIFPRLNYQIDLNTLVAGGHLVPWRAKEGESLGPELVNVKISKGEYDARDLANLLLRGVHIQSAAGAYQQYGEVRDKVLVFAVSIEHAEKLAQAFFEAGHSAAAVHSRLSDHSRTRILKNFDQGDLKVLVNVGILTEGWDSPRVNLIMMCRPTKAPALFVQMIGRGTRLHPGKADLLILDMADNFQAHGDPSDPRVVIPGDGGGQAPVKVCPTCQEIIFASTLTCPACGHHWVVELVEPPLPPLMTLVKTPPPGKSRVMEWQAYGRVSHAGRYMLVLDLYCRPGGLTRHWMDIEGVISDYRRGRAKLLWWRLTGRTEFPVSVAEAASRVAELKMPEYVTLVQEGKWRKIKEFN